MKPGLEFQDQSSNLWSALDAVTWARLWPSQKIMFLLCPSAETISSLLPSQSGCENKPVVWPGKAAPSGLIVSTPIIPSRWPTRRKGIFFFLTSGIKHFPKSKWIIFYCIDSLIIHLTSVRAWREIPPCTLFCSDQLKGSLESSECQVWLLIFFFFFFFCKQLKGSEVLSGAFCPHSVLFPLLPIPTLIQINK